jgi:hypothetical protein
VSVVCVLGREWWRRGRGPHVCYALKEDGDDGFGPMSESPIFVRALRERPFRRLVTVGWRAIISDGAQELEIDVRVRGWDGRLRIMRKALAVLGEMRVP